MNWTGLLELIRWARATPAGARYASEFAERFDVEAITDFLAIHVLTHDLDSLDIDYWLYRDEAEGAQDPRWRFIPWDKNLTFGTHYFSGIRGENDYFDYDQDFLRTMGNALVTKFMQTPALRDALYARLAQLMAEDFELGYYQQRIDALRPVVAPSMARQPDDQAYVVHPGQNHSAPGFLDYHLKALIDFVELRYRFVARRIEGASGPAYATSESLSERSAGEVVYFTDPRGWTLARLELGAAVSSATVSARVEEQAGLDGVDRLWSFEVDGDPIQGKLSLYYRNTPTENWYAELEPIGRQWELALARPGQDGGEPIFIESTTNPYSNRVEAEVSLAGQQRFVLLHR